jgi:hypothetical protein
VFADAHGPCEEFWWADPSDCAGTPYRELAVYVDGRLAGAAPAYPGIYTGAGGPGLWEPIPAPRAWNLRPYDLDLTPFVPLLTDGKAHLIQLGVLDATLAQGDFWQLAANLQLWQGKTNQRTTGRLRVDTAPSKPTDSIADPTGTGVPYADTASHTLTFAGVRRVAGHLVTTTVREQMGETAHQAVEADDGAWTWSQSSTSTTGGHTTVVAQSYAYGLVSDLLTTYSIEDRGSTTTTVDGKRTGWSAYDETMRTADATGIAFNGVEEEEYGYSDASGTCYDRLLASQAGELTADQMGRHCPAAP